MKKLLNSVRFVFKVFLLIILLIVGWAYVNVTNLVKGKKSPEKDTADLWGVNPASADVPGADVPGGGPPGGPGSCPHVAYFDGKEFRIENDFLIGKPISFSTDYKLIKSLYERGRVGPDLLKFINLPQKRAGRLILQLQEIEEEETFVDRLNLIRVIHPKNSEVVVDSGFEKFSVIDKNRLEEKLATPTRVILNNGAKDLTACFAKQWLWDYPSSSEEGLFKSGDRIEFIFQNLRQDAAPLLTIKSMFRDWMMGEETAPQSIFSFSSLRNSPVTVWVAMLILGSLYLVLGRKALGNALAFVPFFFGAQSQSIRFSYQDDNGKFRQITIHEPRDWRPALETIQLPPESVRADGSLLVRAEFTQRHALNLVGVLQEIPELPYDQEVLPAQRMLHSRLGEVTNVWAGEKGGAYLHLIPGDTVDAEFESPQKTLREDEKETYLMQSSGFYTALRKESKELAGNWEERISQEAKIRLVSLAPLKNHK